MRVLDCKERWQNSEVSFAQPYIAKCSCGVLWKIRLNRSNWAKHHFAGCCASCAHKKRSVGVKGFRPVTQREIIEKGDLTKAYQWQREWNTVPANWKWYGSMIVGVSNCRACRCYVSVAFCGRDNEAMQERAQQIRTGVLDEPTRWNAGRAVTQRTQPTCWPEPKRNGT